MPRGAGKSHGAAKARRRVRSVTRRAQRKWRTEAEHLLGYFDLKVEEGLARTTLSSLLASLCFLEEAGEVEKQDRLCESPALANAVKELGRAAAEEAAKKDAESKGQAPQLPLVLLVDLERVVLDPRRTTFQRAFAAFRLLRHWGSLRWDDTQGLPPSSLEWRARGVTGLLKRTKTSGPGKPLEVLPVFVSQEAWIEQEWLRVGLDLLTKGSFDFERDFLLPLPTADLQAATKRRALYSDSAGFSLGLLGSLKDETGGARLPQGAARFWSEHSDRAGLDSWASALGVQESERRFLGRWSPQGSADAYVRTALRVVENIQVLVALHARRA